MSPVTIASVVEGDGEIQAVPVLLRRIADELQVWDLAVVPPYRVTRKEWLSQRMATHSYKPVADQAALTAAMDMGLARRNAASFDKFVRDIAVLLTTE